MHITPPCTRGFATTMTLDLANLRRLLCCLTSPSLHPLIAARSSWQCWQQPAQTLWATRSKQRVHHSTSATAAPPKKAAPAAAFWSDHLSLCGEGESLCSCRRCRRRRG